MRRMPFRFGLVVLGNGSADITRPGAPAVPIQGTGGTPWSPRDAMQAGTRQPASRGKLRELTPKKTPNPNCCK